MINNQIILFKFIQINTNIDWPTISYRYNLSSNFIEKFKDEVNWLSISEYQKLSEDFIMEF